MRVATSHAVQSTAQLKSIGGRKCQVQRPAPLQARAVSVRAAQTSQSVAEKTSFLDLSSQIQFLKDDLPHLFDDQGIDASMYEPNVNFEDPITRHTSLTGYLMNIAFLKTIFDPTFELLDIKQTGPAEITTRWSMTMAPTFVRLPALQRVWNPVLKFTGTSIMGVNPATGKFSSHADTWDAVEDQAFFSLEAFAHMMSQVADLRRVPLGLESPPYTVVKKKAQYEVRRYDPFLVAEADYSRPEVSGGMGAFGVLAGYIFGKNAESQRMEMTTPVYSTTDRMEFYIGGGATAEKAPKPLSAAVAVKERPGGLFAVATFSGIATDGDGVKKAAELGRLLAADGLPVLAAAPDESGKAVKNWVLARWNDPGTLPPFRRNEVMIPLDEERFQLW